MKEMTLQEIHKTELSVLCRFHNVCEKHGLRYSLAYGSLLGAIRHKGFIPWDDDVDVMMPRPDYLKFVSLFETEFKGSTYGLASMHGDIDFFAPLAKMYDKSTLVVQDYGQIENIEYGVYIDIFVVDGLPEKNEALFYRKAERLRFKWAMANKKIIGRRSRNVITLIGGIIVSLCYKIRGYKYYRNLYDDYSSQYAFDSAERVAVIVYGEGLEKESMFSAEFKELSKVEFEGHTFCAIKDPDIYLRKMYGNYMQLPPVEQRKSKHRNIVYRL